MNSFFLLANNALFWWGKGTEWQDLGCWKPSMKQKFCTQLTQKNNFGQLCHIVGVVGTIFVEFTALTVIYLKWDIGGAKGFGSKRTNPSGTVVSKRKD